MHQSKYIRVYETESDNLWYLRETHRVCVKNEQILLKQNRTNKTNVRQLI